ncbi:hypothetical protein ACIQ9E_15905 [Streptomyces sp. NPDC094448]|uniref:hypothetical protein n=1 Tax=Streptomyces sp. NPDC094448 TaxID=3366063 RepID=UPI0038025A1E
MTREGLLRPLLKPPNAECRICGRRTTAPVEVHPGHLTCPEHILDALTAPGDPA